MSDFFSSPSFLWTALGISILVAVATFVLKNLSWTPRGITPRGPGAPPGRPGLWGLMTQGPSRYFFIGIGVLALLALVAWGISSTGSLESPDLATVRDWSQTYWSWIALAAVATALFVRIKWSDAKWVKTVLSWLMIVVLLLTLGIPLGFWIRDAFLPQIICKNATSLETRECLLNTAWSSLVTAERAEDSGMRLCVSPGGRERRLENNGVTFRQFRASEGRLLKKYRLFPAETTCSKIQL